MVTAALNAEPIQHVVRGSTFLTLKIRLQDCLDATTFREVPFPVVRIGLHQIGQDGRAHQWEILFFFCDQIFMPFALFL